MKEKIAAVESLLQPNISLTPLKGRQNSTNYCKIPVQKEELINGQINCESTQKCTLIIQNHPHTKLRSQDYSSRGRIVYIKEGAK